MPYQCHLHSFYLSLFLNKNVICLRIFPEILSGMCVSKLCNSLCYERTSEANLRDNRGKQLASDHNLQHVFTVLCQCNMIHSIGLNDDQAVFKKNFCHVLSVNKHKWKCRFIVFSCLTRKELDADSVCERTNEKRKMLATYLTGKN